MIAEHGPPSRMIAKSGMSFRSLAKSILYQQLAGKAAACIYARFLTTCGIDSSSSGTSGEAVGDEQLLPQHVLKTHASMLRACGLSERKASYVLELAQHFHDGKLSDEVLAGNGMVVGLCCTGATSTVILACCYFEFCSYMK